MRAPLYIFAVIVCLFGTCVTIGACPNYTGAHKKAAEEQARAYASDLGFELKAVSCVQQDTDGDGYVSCTLRYQDDTTHQVECAGAWNLNTGCRDPKLNVGIGVQ